MSQEYSPCSVPVVVPGATFQQYEVQATGWSGLLQTPASGPGAPSAWYRLENGNFNLYTPEIFPMQPGFTSAVGLAQATGSLVMPYFNLTVYSNAAPNYGANAVDTTFALIDIQDKPYMQSNASCGMATWCCQGNSAWQNFILSVAQQLITTTACKGLYLDYWSGHPSFQCYGPGHSHPLGGCSYWAEGKLDIASSIKSFAKQPNVVGPDFFLTSEGVDETLIPVLDIMFHSALWDKIFLGAVDAHYVPLFNTVYHEYINASSFMTELIPDELRSSTGSTWGVDASELILRRAAVAYSGELLSITDWNISNNRYLGEQANSGEAQLVSFYQNDVAFFERAAPYIKYGRRLRPLDVTSVPDAIPGLTDLFPHPSILQPEDDDGRSVFASVWRSANQAIGIVFVNFTDQPRSIGFNYDPALYGVSGSFSAVGDDGVVHSPLSGVWTHTYVIPAASYFLCEITAP